MPLDRLNGRVERHLELKMRPEGRIPCLDVLIRDAAMKEPGLVARMNIGIEQGERRIVPYGSNECVAEGAASPPAKLSWRLCDLEIEVLGEPLDQPVGFREARPA